MNIRMLFGIIAVAAVILAGCKSSTLSPRGQLAQKDRCQLMAEDLSHFRAHAFAQSEREQFARDQAVAIARNELAGAIAAGIVSTINVFNSEVGAAGLTSLAEQDILQNVREILRGSRVVCSDTYVRQEGRGNNSRIVYTASVCVELNPSVIGDMFDRLNEAHIKAVKTREDFLRRMMEERKKYEEARERDREATGF